VLIQFSASESNILEDIPYYRAIVKAIHANDSELALDWVEKAYSKNKEINHGKVDTRNWASIHKQNIDALHRADLCIFEASAKSFAVGFQTALALHLQKPTLVLTRNDSLRNSFGSGIVSNLLTYKTYDLESLQGIVHEFVRENNLKVQDLRFNFVIDREIHNYLRWAAFKNNTTKAEVIRRILRGKIDENH
jgi:hypothetical protein